MGKAQNTKTHAKTAQDNLQPCKIPNKLRCSGNAVKRNMQKYENVDLHLALLPHRCPPGSGAECKSTFS